MVFCNCSPSCCSLQNDCRNGGRRLEWKRSRMLTSHWADGQTSVARNAILGKLVWACIHLSRNMRWSTWELSGSGRHEANHHWRAIFKVSSLPFAGAPLSRWGDVRRETLSDHQSCKPEDEKGVITRQFAFYYRATVRWLVNMMSTTLSDHLNIT